MRPAESSGLKEIVQHVIRNKNGGGFEKCGDVACTVVGVGWKERHLVVR